MIYGFGRICQNIDYDWIYYLLLCGEFYDMFMSV